MMIFALGFYCRSPPSILLKIHVLCRQNPQHLVREILLSAQERRQVQLMQERVIRYMQTFLAPVMQAADAADISKLEEEQMQKAAAENMQCNAPAMYQQNQLLQWAAAHGLQSVDELVRGQGDCGANTTALLFLCPDAEASWLSQRSALSLQVRQTLVARLRQLRDEFVPNPHALAGERVTFSEMQSYSGESYDAMLTRMSGSGYGHELNELMFMAAAVQYRRRIVMVVSNPAQQPSLQTFYPVLDDEEAMAAEPVYIANRAGVHYFPLLSGDEASPPLFDPPLSLTQPATTLPCPPLATPAPSAPGESIVHMHQTRLNDVLHICVSPEACPTSEKKCLRCHKRVGTCLLCAKVDKYEFGFVSLSTKLHQTCLPCRISQHKHRCRKEESWRVMTEEEFLDFHDGLYLDGRAVRTSRSSRPSGSSSDGFTLRCYCSSKHDRLKLLPEEKDSKDNLMSSSPATVEAPPTCQPLSESNPVFSCAAFASVSLNDAGYEISGHAPLPRVSTLLQFGFTSLDDFMSRVAANKREQVAQTIEQSRLRGTKLHAARAKWLQAAQSGTRTSDQILSREFHLDQVEAALLKQTLVHDQHLLDAGWLVVMVEQPLFSKRLGFGGTPDAVFYHKPSVTCREALLVTDLKYSRQVQPLQTQPIPSPRFECVFSQSPIGFHDTLYHRHGTQLNAYMILAREYIPEIRRFYSVAPPVVPLQLKLELIVVHETHDNGIKLWPYPVSDRFSHLLASWHRHQGSPELLAQEYFTARASRALSDLPDGIRTEETMLALLGPAMSSNKKILPSDRTLSSAELQGYNCAWSARVQVSALASGARLLAVQEVGSHNEQCNRAARLGFIPQALSPRMHSWCEDCMQAGLTPDQVEGLCFRANSPLQSMVGPPPRPAVCWEPKYMRLRRFCPQKSLLQKLQQKQKHSMRLDASDEKSITLKIAQTQGIHSLPTRASACTCAQANPSRPVLSAGMHVFSCNLDE